MAEAAEEEEEEEEEADQLGVLEDWYCCACFADDVLAMLQTLWQGRAVCSYRLLVDFACMSD